MPVRLIFIVMAAFVIGGLAALTLRGGPNSGVVHTGKALIGGPFSLADQSGKRVTDEQFRGKYMLVFFGYTYCPDICPAELQVMSAAMEKLGAKADRVAPIFITIDPERDDVATMSGYVSNFDKRFVGLTGTAEEIKAAASAYRVYYAKADGGAPDAYLMDHSTFVYLMDPKGEYVTHFGYGMTADQLADGIAKAMSG
ncbi:MAG: SCO family protein [Rhodomicrobium sp.]|nr:SCO family protein [Rhodomicrobium sp.]